MRNSVIIGLLLISLVLQTGGLHLLMQYRQMYLKRQMKVKLKANPGEFEQTVFEFELVNGKPTELSFEWEEEGDEFRLNGAMYDVIEKKIKGNRLLVRCISDKDEDNIIRKIEALNRGSRHKKTEALKLQQWLSLLLFNQHNCCELIAAEIMLFHTGYYNLSLNTVFEEITIPPPRNKHLQNC